MDFQTFLTEEDPNDLDGDFRRLKQKFQTISTDFPDGCYGRDSRRIQRTFQAMLAELPNDYNENSRWFQRRLQTKSTQFSNVSGEAGYRRFKKIIPVDFDGVSWRFRWRRIQTISKIISDCFDAVFWRIRQRRIETISTEILYDCIEDSRLFRRSFLRRRINWIATKIPDVLTDFPNVSVLEGYRWFQWRFHTISKKTS